MAPQIAVPRVPGLPEACYPPALPLKDADGVEFKDLTHEQCVALVQYLRCNCGYAIQTVWTAYCKQFTTVDDLGPTTQSKGMLAAFLGRMYGSSRLSDPHGDEGLDLQVVNWSWESTQQQFMLAHTALWTLHDAQARRSWANFVPADQGFSVKTPCWLSARDLATFLLTLDPELVRACPRPGNRPGDWPALEPPPGLTVEPWILRDVVPTVPPAGPALRSRRTLALIAAEPVDPKRRGGRYDRHINHAVVDFVRRIHQDIEGLWRQYVRQWQDGVDADTRDISTQLNPRTWHHGKCAEFLEAVYGEEIPPDGLPTRFPWNGRRGALGHLLGWLTGARDRLDAPTLRPAWAAFLGDAATDVGVDPLRHSEDVMLRFLAEQRIHHLGVPRLQEYQASPLTDPHGIPGGGSTAYQAIEHIAPGQSPLLLLAPGPAEASSAAGTAEGGSSIPAARDVAGALLSGPDGAPAEAPAAVGGGAGGAAGNPPASSTGDDITSAALDALIQSDVHGSREFAAAYRAAAPAGSTATPVGEADVAPGPAAPVVDLLGVQAPKLVPGRRMKVRAVQAPGFHCRAFDAPPPRGRRYRVLLPGTVFGPTLEVSLTQVVHRGVARAFLTGRIQGPQGPEWVNLWSNRNRQGTLTPTPYAYHTNDPVTDPGLRAEWRELPKQLRELPIEETDDDDDGGAGPGVAGTPQETPEAGRAESECDFSGDEAAPAPSPRQSPATEAPGAGAAAAAAEQGQAPAGPGQLPASLPIQRPDVTHTTQGPEPLLAVGDFLLTRDDAGAPAVPCHGQPGQEGTPLGSLPQGVVVGPIAQIQAAGASRAAPFLTVRVHPGAWLTVWDGRDNTQLAWVVPAGSPGGAAALAAHGGGERPIGEQSEAAAGAAPPPWRPTLAASDTGGTATDGARMAALVADNPRLHTAPRQPAAAQGAAAHSDRQQQQRQQAAGSWDAYRGTSPQQRRQQQQHRQAAPGPGQQQQWPPQQQQQRQQQEHRQAPPAILPRPRQYHNDTLYSLPRSRVTWERAWSYRHNRYETWADVINRLKRDLGCMFVEGWQRACDKRDGRSGATYDPTRAPPQHQPPSFFVDFSRDFLVELAAHEYDIRNLAWHRGLQIDWNAVWDAQEARASDAARKGGGKRGAPDTWPSGPSVRSRGL